jgi:hypothetical protein
MLRLQMAFFPVATGLDPVAHADSPRARQCRMDCPIKHALGAAKGRTRVSGNDDDVNRLNFM